MKCSPVLNFRITEMTHETNNLQQQLTSLDEKLANERKLTAEREDLTRDEIKKLKEDIKERELEYYHSLQVLLDSELKTFRQVLSDEEDRLQLYSVESTTRPISTTQPSTTLPSVRDDDSAQVKREHKSSKQQLSFADTIDDGDKLWSNNFIGIGNMTSFASGGLKICSVDSKGYFVKIVNTGDQPDQMNGCNIQQLVNDRLVAAFNFPNGVPFDPGQTITVWAQKSGMTHNAPPDYVWHDKHRAGPLNQTPLHYCISINRY